MTSSFQVVPELGMCNRLRAIASSVYTAKKLGVDTVTIYWSKNGDCGAHFCELFDPIDIPGVKVKRLNRAMIHLLPPSRKYLKLPNGEFLKWRGGKLFPLDFYLPKIIQVILFSQTFYGIKDTDNKNSKALIKSGHKATYLATCYAISKCYDYKELLVPIAPIKKLIDSVIAGFSARTVGVHIRRTDNIKAMMKTSIEDFAVRMRAELGQYPETKFYLASDDPEVKRRLVNEFADAIVTYEGALNRSSAKGMRDAVVDLWCLSSTSFILGSYHSSYSQTASEIGGVKLDVL